MSGPPDGPLSRAGNRTDVTAGLVVATAGIGLFLAALGIEAPPGGAGPVRPSTFPVTVSLLLTLSGVILAGTGARTRLRTRRPAGPERTDGTGNAEEPAGSAEEPAGPAEPPVPSRRLVLMIGLFAAYALAFIPLGHLIATTAYLFATTTLIDRERWLRNICFAVAFSAVVHFTFTGLLGIELPVGLLG